MAFVVTKHGEERLPGRAIPRERCRKGILGELDAMSFSEFRKMSLLERGKLLVEAYDRKFEKSEAFRRKLISKGYDLRENALRQALLQQTGIAIVTLLERALCREKRKFPVISDDTPERKIVFIIDPNENNQGIYFHKYVVIKEKETGTETCAQKKGTKEYVIIAPVWGFAHHTDIIEAAAKSLGFDPGKHDQKFYCDGGGYVAEGDRRFREYGLEVDVHSSSDSYGRPADAMQIAEAVKAAIMKYLSQLLAFCEKNGWRGMEKKAE